MAVPKAVVWPRDPHTAAKHDLLKKYLQPWAPILLTHHDSVTYAEGFAGPGVYEGGEPGSPVVAHQVFAEALQQRPKRVRLVLVEEDARRVEKLQRQLTLARQHTPDEISARMQSELHTGTCHPILLDRLRAGGHLGKPLFVLLDSYGGPDIPFSLLQQLAQYKRTEVMLTFVPNFLTRFAAKNDGHRGAGDAAFGGTEWHGVFTQPAGRKFAYLRDRYRESIKRAGFTYTLHFEMVDEGGHPLYLLYGTRHELGVEKMKDAMWSVDPAYGIQYRDPKDVQQQALDLQFEPNTDPLRRMLLEFIAESPAGRAVEDLQQYTLLETVYRPAQVVSLIEKMRDDEAVATEPRRITKKTQVFPYAKKPGQCELF
ncbi:hypothetical protein CG747_14415 [Streptomyces sp. CB02959]|uniref:three-Cys-motif partner protein TcmP n=1 Tax=Streptomyces sp. CB02959 TaxID=2020330 RepID=UPI000C27AC98|nr:three-Cys-motif partner protein TcmP [Streptomyces sp. CB02959]PJN40237.1 hypothetical protein CG747_14415 [Streptomyces sp. CB02959]